MEKGLIQWQGSVSPSKRCKCFTVITEDDYETPNSQVNCNDFLRPEKQKEQTTIMPQKEIDYGLLLRPERKEVKERKLFQKEKVDCLKFLRPE